MSKLVIFPGSEITVFRTSVSVARTSVVETAAPKAETPATQAITPALLDLRFMWLSLCRSACTSNQRVLDVLPDVGSDAARVFAQDIL
jgi:hypothetical protein